MVQELRTKPSIFGSLGKGIGKGLAEQAPKEIERHRLSSALKELSQQKDQTPFQQFSGLVQAAHEYPQVVQSGADLLRQQSLVDAYKKSRGNSVVPNQEQQNLQSNLNNVQFAQQQGQIQRNQPQKQQTIPSDYESRISEATSNVGAASENPLNEKYIPAQPWNQQRQEQSMNEAFDRGLARNFDEANDYANKQRQFYENAPEKYREALDYRKSIDNEVDKRFDDDLQTRLQKEGKESFKDVPGDLQLNIKKTARNAVATGKMNPAQAAEYYSKKALDLVKDRNEVKKIANRDAFDRILPHKKEETLKNLKNISKTFRDMGSSEDYYNQLRDDSIDPQTGNKLGLGLSPGAAAIIAYPRSDKVKDLEKKTKIFSLRAYENSADFAEKLLNSMSPDDSFLAAARQMKQQDVNFDEYAFFDYLRENQDKFASNPRLNREINQGVSDFFPNWNDITLFPAFTKSVAND